MGRKTLILMHPRGGIERHHHVEAGAHLRRLWDGTGGKQGRKRVGGTESGWEKGWRGELASGVALEMIGGIGGEKGMMMERDAEREADEI
jgi:hypothetical protein